MGRKPNKLVQDFFERGAKLEDSSNRYQHTCKSCGEKFPKGRIDSLTAHLLKKCPGLSHDNRQKILTDLSEKPNQNGTYNQLAISMRQEQDSGENHAFMHHSSQNPSMSGLDALAEVSRQQLGNKHETTQSEEATGSKKRKRGQARKSVLSPYQNEFQLNADPVNMDPFEGFEHARRGDSTLQEGFHHPAGSDSVDHVNENFLQSIQQFTANQSESQLDDQTVSQLGDSPQDSEQGPPSAAPTARMVSNNLAIAASAANRMLPQALRESNNHEYNNEQSKQQSRIATRSSTQAIDPQLQDTEESDQSMQAQSHSQMHSQPQVTPHRTIMMRPSSIPHVQYLNDFSISTDQPKPKMRARFSDVRRKEVQEVRKQGACIRCRMLKKPCSGGTPCNTCRNVESARLWKQPCMRAKIADEFDLYGAGVHTIIAFHEINLAKEYGTFERSQKKIEATHFPEGDIAPASFSSQRGQPSNAFSLGFLSTGDIGAEVELLDYETDNISEVLGQYFKLSSHAYFENEISNFMRPTLLLASDLASQKLDPLLSRALELWISTQVLVDPNIIWDLKSVHEDENRGSKHMKTYGTEISPHTNPSSHRLITAQLCGWSEKRSHQIAKSLINDLEKRLLQRQQTQGQHFETFLAAVILLNCMEKMCWVFSTWAVKWQGSGAADGNEQNNQQNRIAGVDEGMDGVAGFAQDFERTRQNEFHERGTWPLDQSPQSYVDKGDNIANLITMLLKMRGIPPSNVILNEEGELRAGDGPPPTSQHRFQNDENSSAAFSTSSNINNPTSIQSQFSTFPQSQGQSAEELVAHLAQATAAATAGDNNVPDTDTSQIQFLNSTSDSSHPQHQQEQNEDGNQENEQPSPVEFATNQTSSSQHHHQETQEETPYYQNTTPLTFRPFQPPQSNETHHRPINHNQNPNQTPNPNVSAWFEAIHIKEEDLRRIQEGNGVNWDERDCRCWELRFVGRLLLPDG